jgi:hypothetical protein
MVSRHGSACVASVGTAPAAATLVAKLGDITRFPNSRQLMAYLGPVPSEHSSGATRRVGVTRAMNSVAKRTLIEAAWGYGLPTRTSCGLLLRRQSLARPILDDRNGLAATDDEVFGAPGAPDSTVFANTGEVAGAEPTIQSINRDIRLGI